jgi:hypothetical protein
VPRWLCVCACALALGCSKKEPAETQRKAPWPATPPDAARALAAHYVVAERCSVPVRLEAKEATIRGTFRVCRGELDVDLLDLTRTKARLSVDLGSIEMLGEGPDAGRSDELSREAQNWLDLGSSRPEAERERLRWAIFELTAIEEPSTTAAHSGKLEKGSEPGAPAAPEDEDAGSASKNERRVVTMNARGSLRVHDVQVDVTIPLRAVFHFAGSANASAVPTEVSLRARRAVAVSLLTHDIKPRDASGVFQSQSMKLLGSRGGAEARVVPEITALLRPR